MESLIGKFGSTQWEPPIDEEDAKWYNGGNGIQGHQGLVGRVISDDGKISTIFFGDRTMRFYKKDFKVYKKPDFVWGDKALIIDKNIGGRIIDFTWHLNKEEYFYFIEVNGKKLKKRYFAEDLKKI